MPFFRLMFVAIGKGILSHTYGVIYARFEKRWLNLATHRKWMEEDCFPFPGKFENLLMNYCWTLEVDLKFLGLPDRQRVWHHRCVHYQLFVVFLKKFEMKTISKVARIPNK